MLIYKIESLIDGRMYIGQTNRTLKKRMSDYKNRLNDKSNQQYIIRSMRKYGMENFKFIVIDYASTQEQLDNKEKFWIQVYSSHIKGIGFNLDLGGKGVGKLTDEHKEKLRIAVKKYHSNPINIENNTGEKNPNSKLNWEVVRKIREEYQLGSISQATLSKKYNIAQNSIWLIIHNKSWRI